MTPQALPKPIVLRSHWLDRGLDWWADRVQQLRERRVRRQQARALRRLPAHVLNDIGAPGWVHEEAARQRGREAMDRSLLRDGIVIGARW